MERSAIRCLFHNSVAQARRGARKTRDGRYVALTGLRSTQDWIEWCRWHWPEHESDAALARAVLAWCGMTSNIWTHQHHAVRAPLSVRLAARVVQLRRHWSAWEATSAVASDRALRHALGWTRSRSRWWWRRNAELVDAMCKRYLQMAPVIVPDEETISIGDGQDS